MISLFPLTLVDLGGGRVLVWFLHGHWGLSYSGPSFPGKDAVVSGIGTKLYVPCVMTLGLLELYHAVHHSKLMALNFVSYTFESGVSLKIHPEYTLKTMAVSLESRAFPWGVPPACHQKMMNPAWTGRFRGRCIEVYLFISHSYLRLKFPLFSQLSSSFKSLDNSSNILNIFFWG